MPMKLTMATAKTIKPVTFHLAVQYASKRPGPDRQQLRRWVNAALNMASQAQNHEAIQLTLRFVDEVEGRSLNRDFRHKDYATNVLTFPYDEPNVLAADIVLCVPVVAREAREQHKVLKNHFAHLVVHGVLHACGHDHEDKAEAEVMEALEAQILARFGIADPYGIIS